MSVIIYGPPGCGKTRNSIKLAWFFGMRRVKEDNGEMYQWVHAPRFKTGKILYLTNVPPPEYLDKNRRILSFDEAMEQIEGAINGQD